MRFSTRRRRLARLYPGKSNPRPSLTSARSGSNSGPGPSSGTHGLLGERRRLERRDRLPDRVHRAERPLRVASEPPCRGGGTAGGEALCDPGREVGALLEHAHCHPERVLEVLRMERDQALLGVLVADLAAEPDDLAVVGLAEDSAAV